MANKHNTSPLYFTRDTVRSSTRLYDILRSHFQLENVDAIIFPFFSSGSFELFLQSKYDKPLITNVCFRPLYQFWSQVKENKNVLCHVLSTLPLNTDSIHHTTLQNESASALHHAVAYVVVNQCLMSSSISRIQRMDLSKMELWNQNTVDFLRNHDSDSMFVWGIPPRYQENKSKTAVSRSNSYHGCNETSFDHEALKNILQTKPYWMIVYNNCEYIRTLYRGYKIIKDQWTYGRTKSPGREIVILSIRV